MQQVIRMPSDLKLLVSLSARHTSARGSRSPQSPPSLRVAEPTSPGRIWTRTLYLNFYISPFSAQYPASNPAAMSSAPKQRLQQLSQHLQVPPPDPGTFEGIPKLQRVADDSAGQYQSLPQTSCSWLTF